MRALAVAIGGRVLATLPVVLIVLLVAFAAVRLVPGDPLAASAPVAAMPAEDIALLRADLGLDAGLGLQFARYVEGLARGDLGRSMLTGRPVGAEIARRLPATLELAAAGLLLALAIALPAGAIAARHPGGAFDRGATALGAFWGAIPTFASGLVLIHLFYTTAGLAPEPTGRWPALVGPPPARTGFLSIDAALSGDLGGVGVALAHLALPALTMALFAVGPILRVTRAALISARGAAHVEAARLMGLGPRAERYAWRTGAAPILGVAVLVLAWMLGANVVVERVFAWPGIGSYALGAALGRDPAPVQGVLLVTAVLIIAAGIAADALRALVAPGGDG
jgi:ABC-type dipeptide/oligopeptide/nickel transport system permease component